MVGCRVRLICRSGAFWGAWFNRFAVNVLLSFVIVNRNTGCRSGKNQHYRATASSCFRDFCFTRLRASDHLPQNGQRIGVFLGA